MKSVLILTRLFTLLVTLTVTFSQVICPDDTECPRKNTCCPSRYGGYGCCSKEQATCCSDLSNCCPYNTICDVARDACLKKAFFRMQYYTLTKTQLSIPFVKNKKSINVKALNLIQSLKDIPTVEFKDVLDFVSSFFESVGYHEFSKFVKSQEEAEADVKVKLQKLVTDVQNGNVMSFFNDTNDYIETIGKTHVHTQAMQAEFVQLNNTLSILNVHPEQYFELMTKNMAFHQDELYSIGVELTNALSNKNFTLAGKVSGDYVKTLFNNDSGKLRFLVSASKDKCEELLLTYISKIKEFFLEKSIVKDYEEYFKSLIKGIKEQCAI